jgi:uncharacterized protein (DUF1778 family)
MAYNDDLRALRSLHALEPGQELPMASASSRTAEQRGARLEARVSAAQKSLLQRAAALSGRTLSEFVLQSAREAADKVIQDHAAIELSRSEQIAFVSTLLNPPKPSARLRRAAAAYRRQMGL